MYIVFSASIFKYLLNKLYQKTGTYFVPFNPSLCLHIDFTVPYGEIILVILFLNVHLNPFTGALQSISQPP